VICNIITALCCVRQEVISRENDFANSSEYGYTLYLVNRIKNEQEG